MDVIVRRVGRHDRWSVRIHVGSACCACARVPRSSMGRADWRTGSLGSVAAPAVLTRRMVLGRKLRDQEVKRKSNLSNRRVDGFPFSNSGFTDWEEREIPIPVELARLLEKRPHLHSERFVFPSPTGNREHNMLLKCKAVAERAGLNSEKFDLKTFRSTYATRMLRSGFDVGTVQHWMGHKSLETTMRYLVPASDVHDRLDQVVVPSVVKNADPPRKSVQQEVAAGRRTVRRRN